ncbi:hypothetical protein, partial [Microseira wollei]|uniref:hypothetical protein n=1 Tax=Microseira wollei TaxID=467598 RepID=UPI001CFCD7C3
GVGSSAILADEACQWTDLYLGSNVAVITVNQLLIVWNNPIVQLESIEALRLLPLLQNGT